LIRLAQEFKCINQCDGRCYGLSLLGLSGYALAGRLGAGTGLRKPQIGAGDVMTVWEITGALLAIGLLIYLVAVLLRPEDFS
jgi:K+-transporting ATPase KdpF subunit